MTVASASSCSRCGPAASPSGASSGVRAGLQPARLATTLAVLTVGNEVLTGANSSALTPSLLPAMQCIHDALAQLGLDRQVAVTTAHNLGVLATVKHTYVTATYMCHGIAWWPRLWSS